MVDQFPHYLPPVVAHRGASAKAPENTLAALNMAADLGALAVEIDVTVSADGVAVLMHDDALDRCSDGTGPVILKPWAALQKLDVGRWFGATYAGERMPTLEQALDLAAGRGLSVNLELKPTLGWERPTVEAVVEVLDRMGADRINGRVPSLLVSSFNGKALELFARARSDIKLGYLTDAVPDDWAACLAHYGCVSLHCHDAFVTRQLVADVHDHGYRLHVFTVNDPETAKQLFSWGVDAVFTDCPDQILQGLRDED